MGGREQRLAFMETGRDTAGSTGVTEIATAWPRLPLRPGPAPMLLTEAERVAHAAFLETLGAPPMWRLWGGEAAVEAA
jgi:hypothetical protein